MNYYPKEYSSQAEIDFLAYKKHFEVLQQQRFVALIYAILHIKPIKSLTLTVDEVGDDREFMPKINVQYTTNDLTMLVDDIKKEEFIKRELAISFYDSNIKLVYMALSHEEITLENIDSIINEYFDESFFQNWEKGYLEEQLMGSSSIKQIKI